MSVSVLAVGLTVGSIDAYALKSRAGTATAVNILPFFVVKSDGSKYTNMEAPKLAFKFALNFSFEEITSKIKKIENTVS